MDLDRKGAPADRQPALTPLRMFTATYTVTIRGLPAVSPEDLASRLVPRGAVKAINCNFAHLAQPGYEHYLKVVPKHQRRRHRDQKIARADVRQRKLQGDGTSFNSAIEVVVAPGPEDNPPPGFAEVFARKPRDKAYALKLFPKTGVTQVPGVIDPGCLDGRHVVDVWLRFLRDAGLEAEGESLRAESPKTILMNFNCRLAGSSSRTVMDLDALVARLEAAKTRSLVDRARAACSGARASWAADREALARRVLEEVPGEARRVMSNFVYKQRHRAQNRGEEAKFDPAGVVVANSGRAVDAAVVSVVAATAARVAGLPPPASKVGPLGTAGDQAFVAERLTAETIELRATADLNDKIATAMRRQAAGLLADASSLASRAIGLGRIDSAEFLESARLATAEAADCDLTGRPVGDFRATAELGRVLGHLDAAAAALEGRVRPPPFPLREIKSVQNNSNISFKFQVDGKTVRVNVFFSGKINILGGKSPEAPRAIYEYLDRTVAEHHAELVGEKPMSDRERAAAREAKELDRCLAWVLQVPGVNEA